MAPQPQPVSRARSARGTSLVSTLAAATLSASLIVGDSDYAEEKRREVAFCAERSCNAVIYGETGSGKDLWLKELQRLLGDRPFVLIPAGNLTASLATSQLFGHLKGSFSGADRDAGGFARRADGGVLAVNDADDVDEAVQQLLLTLAEGGEYWPLGAERPVRAHVRTIVATHVPLSDLARDGRMRADLMHRLNDGIEIRFRPLREHKEDIALLAPALLARAARDLGADAPAAMSKQALKSLLEYDYPGNVRELGSILKRALLRVLYRGEASSSIEPRHLDFPEPAHLSQAGMSSQKHLDAHAASPSLARQRYASCRGWTRERIAEAVREAGSVTAAARAYGLGKRSLWRRMRELGMSA